MHPIGRVAYASHVLPVAALALPLPAAPLLAAWGAVQAGLAAELLRPASRMLAPNVRRGRLEDRVALTFDDGPREGETERLLDRLDEAGIKATFFFVGLRARKAPEAVRRAAGSGHAIGNHSWSHPYLWAAAPRRRILAEVGDAQAALADLTGSRPIWFRPPMGHKNVYLEEALDAHGVKQVTWSLRSYDTLTRDGDRVLRRVLARARGGDIVLLHEGIADRGRTRGLAPTLIEPLIEGLGRRGLRPVSLPELLQHPQRSTPAGEPASPPYRGSDAPAR